MWCDIFKNGRMDTTDEYRVERSPTLTTTNDITRLNNIIQMNRRVTTVDEIAETLGISFLIVLEKSLQNT